ncbi:hypothetical protein LCGC14_1830700 [marine sediment metagenome]|uniref:Uncharacterized protein n=1 Tax=marine sediment metagenome TaxID=412755 RepID=A0A0F9JFT2_9ZZZZ
MSVDPKARFTIPPGTPIKRVRVINPVVCGRYINYRYGDELDLPEEDWINHLGLYMEEIGDNPEPWPPKEPEVVKEYRATKKKMKAKSRRIRGRLADVTNEKDGDA